MKILHIGDTAGIPQILSRQQKNEGIKSDVYMFRKDHPFGYEYDILYERKGYFKNGYFPTLRGIVDNIILMSKYDVLHFHVSSLWHDGKDCLLWKLMGKRVILHYHGTKLRENGETRYHERFTDVALVSTPDLLQHSLRAIWIPNPIDIQENMPINRVCSEEVNIFHSTTNWEGKGTAYIVDAVNQLKKEGYKIKFILNDKYKLHRELIEDIKQADIIVDQLLTGWYGVTAIEAMALKKAVCVFIREDLMKYLPFLPFCIVSKNDLVQKLRALIVERELREELGEKGRKFVEQVHDVKLVNEKVMRLYEG
ncbi:MAG: hypothetical protein JW762_09060 [Dehalococcoidales bacterium]|nr:hypothetical protein [Dehalococcoidales bacterium]